MNKLRYRIVFNKLRGQQMVVAETARGAGKGAGTGNTLPAPPQIPRLRPLAQWLAQAFSVSVLLVAVPALAQVVADPGVPGGQRPTVLTAANGVTLVNIQTASSAGVSRNSYTQFDVPKGGVILNNSRTDTQSQLAGWVQANPWLAQGQARVILNEVNSSSPSRLKGFVEVAGQRAEVIIANPSGISVDGGGFINVSRATLTTGSPRFNEGRIDGFTVARGQVSIDGAGLDASSTDYTALIARGVAVNAALWAKQLNVVTGPGEVTMDGDRLGIAGAAAAAQGSKPAYAIDVGRLGGMYANKIFLVGSEAGVGVRNAGNIGASAGELFVTSDGRLENSGEMVASARLRLQGHGIDNSGSIGADADITLAGDTVRNSGAIRSATTMQVAAHGDIDNSAGTLEAARLDLGSAAGSLINRGGRITQGGRTGLDLASAALRNGDAGQVGASSPSAGGGVSFDTGADTSAGARPAVTAATAASITSAGVVTAPMLANGVIRVANVIDNSAGQIGAGGVITLATNAIDNTGGKLYLPELVFNGNAFINRAGTVEVTRQLRVTAPLFDNRGGSIVAGAAVDASVGAFNNSAGLLRADSVRVDTSAAIDNSSGTIASNAAMALSATGDFSNQRGTITAQGPATYTFGANLDNTGGVIQALGPLALTAVGALGNQGGAIEAFGADSTFDLRASAIDSAVGRLVNHGGGTTRIVATSTLFNSGTISAGGALALQAATMRNASGTIVSGSGLVVSADGLDNSGVISSAGTLTYARPDASLRNSGSMVAAGAMYLAAASIDNDGGQLATAAGTGSALLLDTHVLSNRSGAIMADGAVRITATGNIDNARGLVQGASAATLDVTGALDNTGGAIELLAASGQLSVQAGAIDNNLGRIVNAGAGDTRVHSMGNLLNAGLIQGAGALDVGAATLRQSATGQLLSGADMKLTASKRFDNAGAIGSHGALAVDGAIIANSGSMVATGAMHVTAEKIDNNGGQLATAAESGSALLLDTHVLRNRGGTIMSGGVARITATGDIDNTGGLVQGASAATVVVGGTLANTGGVIEVMAPAGQLSVQAGSIENNLGRIVNAGTGDTRVHSVGNLFNEGLIQGAGALHVGAATVRQSATGQLLSGASLQLTASERFDNAGAIGSHGALTVDGAAIANSGQLIASGPVTLRATVFDNDSGQVGTTPGTGGAVTITADSLSNRGGSISTDGAIDAVVKGAFDNNGGKLQSASDLRLSAGGAVTNDGGSVEAGGASLAISGESLSNLGGRIVQIGGGNASIASASSFINSGLVAGNGTLVLDARTFENKESGSIASATTLDLHVAHLLHNAGAIASNGALNFKQAGATFDNSGTVSAGGAMTFQVAQLRNDAGKLATGAALSVQAKGLSNRAGDIASQGTVSLVSADAFDNTGGTLRSNQDLVVQAGGVLDNSGGRIETSGAGSNMQLNAGTIDSLSGRIVNGGTGATAIHATGQVNNSGLIGANGALAIDAAGLDNRNGATVSAGQALAISARQMANAGAITGRSVLMLDAETIHNSGKVVSDAGITLRAGVLANDGGQLATAVHSGAGIDISAASISNHGGNIVADGAITLKVTGALDNSAGQLQANSAMKLQAGVLTNSSGTIATQADAATLAIQAASIGNEDGSIINAGTGAMSVTSAGAVANGGLIQGGGALTLSAQSLHIMAAGKVASGADMLITVGQDFANAGVLSSQGSLRLDGSSASVANSGQIVSAGAATLLAAQLSNGGGQIATAHGLGAGLTVVAGNISNVNGALLADGTATITSGATIDNRGGAIESVNTMTLAASGALNNNAGVIAIQGAQAGLTIGAQAVSNASGRIVNAGSGVTSIASLDSFLNSGLIGGNGAVFLAATALDNQAGGTISAASGLDFRVTGSLTNAGTIGSNGALAFDQWGASFSNSGVVNVTGPVTLHAQAVSNRGGIIEALGDITLDSGAGVDNTYGTMHTAGNLGILAGGSLLNDGGALETTGMASTMHVRAGAISNLAGRIVNGGQGAATIAAGSSFVSSGMVAGNGALAIDAQALDNRAAGVMSAGSGLLLTSGQQLQNAGTISAHDALTIQAANATMTNSGQVVAGATATIAADILHNDGGRIATSAGSGADVLLRTNMLTNVHGGVLADRNAHLFVAGNVDNHLGAIQAGNALELAAGGALTNTGGTIEDGGAGAAMRVAAQSIDNTAGRIVNAGVGLTGITAGASLVNSGVIAGNGAVSVQATSMDNVDGATLSAGAALDLGVTQNFVNHGAISSAGALSFEQAGAQFNNSGTVVTGADAKITAAAIDNSGGHLVTIKNSGAALLLNAGSIANRGGFLLADGSAALTSGAGFDNTSGVVQAGSNLSLNAAGAVGNDGGAIETLGVGSVLYLGTGALANGTGRISNSGNGATTVSSASSVVNNGLIAGNGALAIFAANLLNQAHGSIGSAGNMELGVWQQLGNEGQVSSAGTLNFNQGGARFNNRGKVASNAAMTVTAAAIDNSGGQLSTVRGAGGDIVLHGALVNRGGQVLADGNAMLHVDGGLDNTLGTLQARKDLSLDLSGALDNNGGAIEALGTGSALTVQASAVGNSGGRIVNLGTGDTRLAAADGIVNSGTIGGNGSVFLSGQSLVNGAAGTISAGAGLDFGISQRLENHGAINSAGILTFNQGAAQLVNSGQIMAGGSMLVHAAGVDNHGGQIATGLGSGADFTLSAQSINNDGGRIVADRDLALTTGQLLGGGEAGAGRDLSASLQGDFVNMGGAPHFTARRDLALAVSGNFTNAATFSAVRNLALSAGTVNNLLGATIQAQGVTIRPTGDLSNGGEINGSAFVDIATSGNVYNSGAMVGDTLSLAANNINNDGGTALLGATSAMQLLATKDINNSGGATIYSAGWLAAQAEALNNMSSTVESSGDMAIAASTINNIRENVQIVHTVVADDTTHTTLPSWYTHGDNNDEYDPKSANYRPMETYFVNPSDIISETTFVTPDGEKIGRVEFTTHANDSAFFAAASGAYGKYGHRDRITTSDGTRVLYYFVKENNVANPDQGGPGGNGNPLFNSSTMIWNGPPVTFSSGYGSCSTTCVRYTTQPGYDDPARTIRMDTLNELAPSKDRLEIYRDVHDKAVEDSLDPGAGAVARITAGGNMTLTVSQLLNNQYGEVMATGYLAFNGLGAKVNQAATLYRNHTIDGTWTTENHSVTPFTSRTVAEKIGYVSGVISGGQGVSITGHSFSNIDVTAGTVGIVSSYVRILGSGAGGAVPVASGAASSGVRNQSALQDGFGRLIANDVGSVGIAASSANGAGGGAATMHSEAAKASTAALAVFQDGATDAATVAAMNASAAGQATGVVKLHGGGSSSLAAAALQGGSSSITASAAALQGVHSAGANQSGTASLATARTPAGVGTAFNPGTGSVMAISPSGLFIKNPDANGKYLYETRSQFANLNAWTSSDYLLKALGADPALAQKRLGDGFYEQRMVREQLNQLTGRAPANGAGDGSVYQSLLANAVSAARAYDLRPGIALTADQVSALTSDIVWMESQQVRLPDGSIETVLVPKVYLAHVSDGAVTVGGALVTGGGAGVSINTDGDIVNRGGVINGGSGRTLLISGQDILNQGGTIRGGDVLVAAARDVRNESLASKQTYSSANTSGSYTVLSNQASIVASGTLEVNAGRDVTDVAGRISAANASLTAARDVNFNALATGSTYTAQVGQDAQNNLTVGHALTQVNTTGDLVVSAGRDLTLNGAQLAIGGDGALLAGRALTVASVMDQVRTDEHGDASAKQYDKRLADHQTVIGSNVGAAGTLQLAAGLKETAALTVSSSAVTAGKALALSATGDVLIGGVQENDLLDNASRHASSSVFTKRSNSSTDYMASNTLVGSSLGGGSVSVKSGRDIVVTGSEINAQKDLTMVAGRDLVVASGIQSIDESHSAESIKSGFSLSSGGFGYSKAEQRQSGTSLTTAQLGSTISGGTVTAVAGRDLSVIASNVVADGAVVLAATRDINIVSAQNTMDSASASSSKKSGSIGSAWQPAIGTVKTTQQGSEQNVTQAGSQVASLGGDVTIQAGGRYTQTASDVLAPGGDITILAKNVQVAAAGDTAQSNSRSTFSKTAIGGSVSIPIVSTAQGIASLASAAKQAGSGRMTALVAVTAGMQVADAVKGVTAAGNPTGIKIGVSLGTSKSESSSTQSSSTTIGSQVKAGGNVTIVATGGGKDSNITSTGSDISGGGNVTLAADNKINLLAAENIGSQHSSNSSSGASIGVTYSFGGAQSGFSLDLAANRASGKADGDSLTYGNSHVSAGNTVNLQSGGDVNIRGGVITANTVVGNIGGNLNVQSLQDKVAYHSKQNSAGLGISICLPPACYGASSVSGSVSRAAVNGDFLSVVEQSGIKSRDGGFQLVVHGNTDLIGGVISSSQAAIDQGKNSLATGSLTYTELKNKDVYSADSFAMSGSVSGKFGDQSKAVSDADKLAARGKAAPSATGGFGQDSGNQSSTTASAISAGALTITDATKQAATGKTLEQALAGIATGVTTETAAAQAGAVTQAWNGEALMKEVQAQTQITQAFSAQAPRAIANLADNQKAILEKQLGEENDPTKKAELAAEIVKWDEGGSYRTALHTLSGAASGGVGGALGALAVAGAADPLSIIQEKMASLLEQHGMNSEAAKMAAEALAQGTALGIGAVTGGAAGAATALTADTNNRQSTLAQNNWLKQLQKDRSVAQQKRYADAACALNHCSSGLSNKDPAKPGLIEQERRGQTYISEQKDLLGSGLYSYGAFDSLKDMGTKGLDNVANAGRDVVSIAAAGWLAANTKLQADVANIQSIGYEIATHGPYGNFQQPPDPWNDMGGWGGPSATAVVTPAVPVCRSPFACMIVPPVMMPGVPGYRPNNALLSSNQNDSAYKAHDAVSPSDSITSGQKGLSSAAPPGVNDVITVLPQFRQSYVDEVRALGDVGLNARAAGATPEETARMVSQLRRDLGVQYKNLTPPDELEKIYARNLDKYGDKLGPTIDYMRSVQGKTWEQIIEKASTPGGKDLGY